MFEPITPGPGLLLANAEKDGEAYAASLGVKSLERVARLAGERAAQGEPGGYHPSGDRALCAPAFALRGLRGRPPGRRADPDRLQRRRGPLPHRRSGAVRAAAFGADIAKRWGALPPQLLSPYPHATDAEAVKSRLGFERDLRFGWDIWAWARLQAASGKAVFYYHFTHHPPFPAGSVYAGWGPSHYAELWYTFDHLDQAPWAWTAADRRLAKAMSGYWANFARSGDPNGRGYCVAPVRQCDRACSLLRRPDHRRRRRQP